MTDRVTIRANDAMIAFAALRSAIAASDTALMISGDWPGKSRIAEHRAEQWAAYQRMAKALRIKPTLDHIGAT